MSTQSDNSTLGGFGLGLASLAVLSLLSACGGASTRGPEEPAADPVSEVPAAELFQRGAQLGQSGDFVRAEQYLVAAMARGYPEDEAMPLLLRVCIASSRLQAALSYAEPYLERNPDAWPLRHLVASLHLALGHAERARDELMRVIQTAPDQAEPYYLLALVLRDGLGEPEQAAPLLARYLELAPDGPHAREASDMMPVAVNAAEAAADAQDPETTESAAEPAAATEPAAPAAEEGAAAPRPRLVHRRTWTRTP